MIIIEYVTHKLFEYTKIIKMSNEKTKRCTLELDEIEDARIILKVKGKHYSVISTGDKEEGRMYRIALVQMLLSMEG